MKPLEQQLSDALRTEIPVDTARLEQTMLAVRLTHARTRTRICFGRFVLLQARFSGVRMWLWQGAVMLVLLLGMQSVRIGAWTAYVLRLLPFWLGCCGIATVTAAIPLVYRAARYRMGEIEHACYFSGTQLLLARLLFIGVGMLLTLTVTICAAVGYGWLGAGCAVLYVCAPTLAAVCGDLALLLRQPMERFPVLGGALSGALVVAIRLLLHWECYPTQLSWSSGAVCIGLLLLCAAQLYRLAHTGSAAMQ